MPTIVAARIVRQSSSILTRFNIPGVSHFSYRNVHVSKPILIQSKLDVVIDLRSSSKIMDDKKKQKADDNSDLKGWVVLDTWPTKKRKRSPKKPKSKEETLLGMQKFLLQHDEEFQRDAEPLKKKEKKDPENNPTVESVEAAVKTKSCRDNTLQTSENKLLKKSDQKGAEYSQSKISKFSTSRQTSGQSREFEFSILSYNILADNLMLAHPNLYTECHKEKGVLDWNNRWEGIKREIINSKCPDIICLQEVQFQNPDHATSHIIPFLSSIGYRSVVKPKTGTKDDGCLIAFSRERFELEDTIPVNYKVDRVPVLDRDNVGLILKLVPVTREEGSSRQHDPILVATTHLLYNPRRTDIRLAQSALLLAELDRIAVTNKSLLPIILTGDFNSEPWSPVLGLFLNKRHHYAGTKLGRTRRESIAPDKLLPDSLGLSDSCQWQVTLQQRGAHQNFTTGSGAFSHNINFRSVYPLGGPVTTFQEGWAMVDYILYASHNETLRMSRKQYLPSSQEMTAAGRIPSVNYPSDHLPLLATFKLKLEN